MFCFAEDSLGNAGSYLDAFNSGTQFDSICCKTLMFLTSTPSTALADLIAYAELSASSRLTYELQFSLSAKPSDFVTAKVVFYNDAAKTSIQSDVNASPSLFNFTSSSTKLSANFLAYGARGKFFVAVELSGASVSEFNESPTREVELVETVSTAPLPVISSAEFDSTGQRMDVFFETPTDSAMGVTAGASVWKCDLVLAFTGASRASCRWATSSQIVVVLNYFSVADENLVVGEPVALLGGVLNGICYVDVCADAFAALSSVNATTTTNFIQPTATIKVPAKIGNCESLTVDPTQSTGNAGRAWASVEWTVSAADGSDTSEIQAVFAGYTNTSSVITINASLLSQTTYTVSLGLTNFLQDPALPVLFTAVQTVVVEEESSLFVQISGASYETRVLSRSLSRTASSLLAVCLDGVITTVTPSVSYIWTVFEVSAINNFNKMALVSSSSNPNVFQAASYTFDLDTTYQIIASATAAWGNSTITESASFQVFFKRGEVVALINGHSASSVQTPVNTVLLLDAGGSSDLDDLGATLSYQWSCKDLNVSTFGSDCFGDLGGYGVSDLTASTVSFSALTLTENAAYEFTVIVGSTLSGMLKTSSAKIFVAVTAALNLNMSVTIQPSEGIYSAQKDVVINSVVNSDASSGVTATWSLQSGTVLDLSSSLVVMAPNSRPFTFGEVTNGLNFPLGIHRDVMTAGVDYIFRLTVEDTAGNVIFSEVTVTPNSPPVGGTFAVTPASGFAFITDFEFSAFNWGDNADDYPVEYLFVYQDASSFNSETIFDQISVRSTFFTTSTLLPEGVDSTLACAVFISDYWEATSTREVAVSVTGGDLVAAYGGSIASRRHLKGTAADIDSRSLLSVDDNTYIMNNILPFYLSEFTEAYDALQTVILQSSLLVSANLLVAVDATNCSLSPICENLNRNECSAVSHTCGECLAGFEGVFGDANSRCHNATSLISLPIGAACVKGVDVCLYDNCEDGTCQPPVKICSLGSTNGLECSQRGTCSYTSTQGDLTPDDCRAQDTFCTASCVCDVGFAGSDCSIDDTQINTLDGLRGSLCANLAAYMSYLDPSEDKVSFSVNILKKTFAYDEVVMDSSMDKCVSALSSLDAAVSELDDRPLSDSTRASVVAVISDFIRSALFSSVSSQVESLVSNLGNNILNTMIEGPISVDLVSDNLRLSYKHELLSLLSDTSISAPQTAEEIYHGTALATLDLPATGLSACTNFKDYAKVAVVSWGLNPYTRGSSVTSALFGVATVATTTVTSSVPSPEMSSYQVTLPLVQHQNWTTQEPTCAEYVATAEGGTITDCQFCNVTSYGDTDVTFICNDTVARLCPSGNSLSLSNGSSSSAPYFVLQSVDRPTDTTVLSSDRDLDTKQSRGVFGFMLILFFILIISIALLHCWDERDRICFIHQRNEKKKLGPYQFELTAAFDERGVAVHQIDESSISKLRSHDSENVDEVRQITDGSGGKSVEQCHALEDTDEVVLGVSGADNHQELPLTSLLSFGYFWHRLWTAMKRHHKWVRIFSFPSMQKTRVTRLLVAGTDLLFLLFAVTLFYGLFYPDDNECEKLRTEDVCVDLVSRYFDTNQCQWSAVSGCTLDAPPVNIQFLAFACSLIILFTVLPRRLLQLLLEKICNKRPQVEDICLSSKTMLKAEPALFYSEGETSDFTKHISLDGLPITRHLVPYPLERLDSLIVQDELNAIVLSAKKLFTTTLKTAPLP